MFVSSAQLLVAVLLVALVSAQHRPPPGVNPQQYQHQQTQGQHQQQQFQQPINPPGVNPQQYQQQQQYQPPPPPPPSQQQQYQQPPQQQFQQPQQQQQFQQPPPPPQQQQQFQPAPAAQPQLRQPIQQQHMSGQQMLHKQSLSGERDHIKDHLEVPLDTSGMSEQELQFHYFKMHDADNNNRLDGQELIKSLFHWHDAENHDPSKQAEGATPPHENKLFTDTELTAMIDPILDQDDHNKDGYIDYSEFMAAQQKAASNAAVDGKP